MVSAFSIGKAKRSKNNYLIRQLATYPKSDTPGPGAYQPIKRQKYTPPSYRIGTGERTGLLKQFAPGPGAYDPPVKFTREGPRYTFGLKKPSQVTSMFDPGPGAYNPNYRAMIKALPRYTMGAKVGSGISKTQPGPGTYESKSTVLDVPCMRYKYNFLYQKRFPHSQRLGFYNESRTPGPGTYTNRGRSAGPQYRFGSGQRGSLEVRKYPGPGEYEARSEFQLSQKGFSMISRRVNTHGSDYTPGPGTYNWDKKQKQRPPSYKIGHQNRSGLSKEAQRTPGPGEYESRYEFARPKSAQVRIGSATRRPLQDTHGVPGPGTYDLTGRIGEGPKFQMLGSKYEPSQTLTMPGPGAYNPNDNFAKQRPQSAKIGTGSRGETMNVNKEAPGPGNYNLRGSAEGPRWGFGSSLRPQLNQTDRAVPGPGNYNLKPTFADVPTYLIPKQY